MRWLVVAAVALALGSLECGAATPAPITIANHVHVVVTGASNDDLPFDPRGARLVQATNQLYALVGHPVTFQFDAALLPDWRSGFESLLVADIERVIADLVELRDRWPRVFARGTGSLGTIVFRYDPTEHEQDAKLDTVTRALTVSGGGGAWALERGAVLYVLRNEYETAMALRLGGLEPDAVSPADRADYFEVLTDSRMRAIWRKQHPSPEGPQSDFDTDRIWKLVRLSALAVADRELAAKVRKQLFGALSDFSRAYFEGAPQSASWHRAERVCVEWLNAQLGSATDEERMEIASAVYVRSQGKSLPAFPGFDRFAFGMSIVDAWAKAGHPLDATGPRGQLFGAIVCPSTRMSEGGGRSFAGRCEHSFYQDVFGDEATSRRFAEALLARKDPVLVETAAVEAYYAPQNRDKLDVALGFARLLEASEPLWRVALRTSADEVFEASGEGSAARVVDEARRIWRAYPNASTRHGTLLYAMVQTDRYEHGNVDWEHFADHFGGPVTEQDFAAYLEHGVRALSLARVMWPALGKFARAPLLTARLDAFLDDPRSRSYNSADPYAAVGGISQRLCDEHATADLAELSAFFTRRLTTHPGELFGDKIDDPKTCQAPAVAAAGHVHRHYVSVTTAPSASGHSTVVPLPPSPGHH